MASNPSVSVIIPTFNRAGFLRESVTSVLAQTRPPLEVIVVDDGSTDETRAVIEGFGRDVVYVRKDNGGKAAAINHVLPRVRGDFLWFFDDDDVALPDAIERRLDVLNLRQELRWIFSSFYFGNTGPDGRILRGAKREIQVLPEDDLFERLSINCFFMLQSCLIRRDCMAQIGNFNESLLRSQDYDVLIRLGHRFRFSGIEDPTFILRLHDGLRGPLVERHAAASRRRVWTKYDRSIGRWMREQCKLSDFTANPWDASASVPLDVRLALFKRAVVMASKGLIPEMIEDCVAACAVRAEPLGSEERMLCERLLRFPTFRFAYVGIAPAFWQGVRSLLKTAVGREVLMAYSKALWHQAKCHDTRWSERAHHVSMSLRILVECGLLGWRYAG